MPEDPHPPATGRRVVEMRIDDDGAVASAALAAFAGLPRARVKDAMGKGAVWLRRAGAERRLRRASTRLRRGDVVALHYDPRLLALEPPAAALLVDRGAWSAWDKPPGLLAQGTRFGDHCSLLRQAELRLGPRRRVWLVHRLDREARGLMLLAHHRGAAGDLSEQFRRHAVEKRYRVLVSGDLPDEGSIDEPLDGRDARSDYRVVSRDGGLATVEVRTRTGRYHQVRRHLAAVGCPVLGDRRYGPRTGGRPDLALTAVGLAFRCPAGGARVTLDLDALAAPAARG